MLFIDGNFWLLTFVVGLVSLGISAAITFLYKQPAVSERDRYSYSRRERLPHNPKSKLLKVGLPVAIATMLVVKFVYWAFMPAFQGSFGGYYWPVFFAVVPATVAALFTHEYSRARVYVLSALALVAAFFVYPLFNYMGNAWGLDNAKRLAAQPNVVRIAGPKEVIPPTEPNQAVRVTQSIAAFKGMTALSSQTGNNLGSVFQIDAKSYDLQSINGHRFWVAPLQFKNLKDTMNLSDRVSPGYVYVDAQDPRKEAQLKLGFEIRLFEDASFGLNLGRWLYNKGYTDGNFVDAKFEADDNWAPHWVVTYVQKPFGGVAGQKITKVLVVDVSKATPVLNEYEFGKQPHWIERVNPESVVMDHVTQYGLYSGKYAQDNYWSVFWGTSGEGTMKPAEADLNYTSDDHSVWVMPMTSTGSKDHTVNGVMVADTTKNEMVYYPGISGFNTGASVIETMSHAQGVGQFKNFTIEQVQLYSIYGQLTWMGIITSPQSTGSSYLGIALLHAHGQNSSDVIIAPDLERALAIYANQLAVKGTGGEASISKTAENSKSVEGKVFRIAALAGNINQTATTYTFMVEGDANVYNITRDTYNKVMLVKEGDHVKFTYLDIQGAELAVSSFACKEIDGNVAKAAAPKAPAQDGVKADKVEDRK